MDARGRGPLGSSGRNSIAIPSLDTLPAATRSRQSALPLYIVVMPSGHPHPEHPEAARYRGSWGGLLAGATLRALVNPRLALDLVKAGWAFRRRDWLRRAPFLPVPDRRLPPLADVHRVRRRGHRASARGSAPVRPLAAGDDGPLSTAPRFPAEASRPRVVIVGGGFAGLYAAKALGRAPVSVTVVDRTNYHLFQPMLYQVATAALDTTDIASPIRSILRHQRNSEVLMAEVAGVDLAERRVRCTAGHTLRLRLSPPCPRGPALLLRPRRVGGVRPRSQDRRRRRGNPAAGAARLRGRRGGDRRRAAPRPPDLRGRGRRSHRRRGGRRAGRDPAVCPAARLPPDRSSRRDGDAARGRTPTPPELSPGARATVRATPCRAARRRRRAPRPT